MRFEPSGDLVGLIYTLSLDVTPDRSAARDRSCHMKVGVRNGLVRRQAVVLPNGNPIRIIRTNDRIRSRHNPVHQG